MNNIITAYITKYALTQGIWKCTAETVRDVEGMIVVRRSGNYPAYFHGEGKEWHRTEEEAFQRVDEMRRKKIKSLEKQIEKLEDLIVRVKEIS